MYRYKCHTVLHMYNVVHDYITGNVLHCCNNYTCAIGGCLPPIMFALELFDKEVHVVKGLHCEKSWSERIITSYLQGVVRLEHKHIML